MLEYVPVIGWFWKMSDYISLERSYEKDKEVIPKFLEKICLSSDVLSVSFITRIQLSS
jgi:1-acyl-sn-glycerol-3-phosphate acyltransferase